jgi:hypothetical protein
MIQVADRRRFAEMACTLNGRPARICGIQDPFARVEDKETGLGCEFAWPTVHRIMSNGGRFKSD